MGSLLPQLPGLLLRQAAPARHHSAAVARGGADGLHGGGVHFARLRQLAQLLQGLAEVEETLGVVRPAVDIERQLAAGVFGAAQRQVDGAQLAVDLVERMPLVLL